jgi:toxin ParE1/3/4
VNHYRLSPRARADLDDIWRFTVEQWGLDQAEDYLRRLHAAIHRVVERPTQGAICDEVRPGYRRYRAGSHLLFYRLIDGRVDIVRILHERMDVDQHL